MNQNNVALKAEWLLGLFCKKVKANRSVMTTGRMEPQTKEYGVKRSWGWL